MFGGHLNAHSIHAMSPKLASAYCLSHDFMREKLYNSLNIQWIFHCHISFLKKQLCNAQDVHFFIFGILLHHNIIEEISKEIIIVKSNPICAGQ